MSLLDKFPHECTIRIRTRSAGSLGGSRDVATVEQTGVECWQQRANAKEILEFEKRGMTIDTKVFFTTNPNVTERHEILITKRNGVIVSSPLLLDVITNDEPDASAGLEVVFKVMCNRLTGTSQ